MDLKQDLEQLVRGHSLGSGGIRVTVRYLNGDPERWTLAYFKVPAAQIDKVPYAAGGEDLDEALIGRIGRQLGYGSGSLVLEYRDRAGRVELHWIDLSRARTETW